jgi:proteasome lid subunit RPN8/RPN11
MSNDLVSFVQEEGARQYPNEACGLVVRVGKKSVPVACKNVAENPTQHFVMDVRDYAAASDMGEIIGIWHTHIEIDPTPSDADKMGCENSELPWFIMSVYKAEGGYNFSEMTVTEPSGFEMPYLERPYAFGVLDCWSLVRDYYRREFNIKLGDYPRIERFWANGFDFFGENWKNEGFVQLVNDEEPRTGDLFLIQTDGSGNPNHIAIYLGDEVILHHCHGRLSRRDIYGGYWNKHTTHHLRHKSKC